MASLVHRQHFTIEWGHCDPAGIVFNSRFFEFFDRGTWGLFETALGVRPSDLAETFADLRAMAQAAGLGDVAGVSGYRWHRVMRFQR